MTDQDASEEGAVTEDGAASEEEVASQGDAASEEGTATEEDAASIDRPTFSQEIVVTGTRAQPRTVVESMVPIDMISAKDFEKQGDSDLSNQLRTLVPSYNVNVQPISDAATVVRPANLRNLAPDHTLVLINNKRRHRAAVIYWLGNGVADGAQGPDISTIPSIALRQVEVLRDGASAQYGSDAIAGVLNFLLKDSPDGGSFLVKSGFYQEGDGEMILAEGNIGFPLTDTGFANLSFSYGTSQPTSRSVQRDDAAALISAGNNAVANPAQVWGSPEIDNDLKLFGNFGYLTGGGIQLYSHANFASKTVTGGFYFRNPNTRAAVFSGDGGETLLIGDLNGGGSGCPTVQIINDVPDPVALAEVFARPECFSFQEIFPGGFTPQFGGDVIDYSVVAGVKGQTSGGINWDASASLGFNKVDFFISNTVNASLGPDTPTEFDPGAYSQRDISLNVDASYAVNDMVNVAAGVEFRDENFEIGIGQLESYEIGPLADQGFSAASNGFPGFGDIAAGDWSRSNYAIYTDVELKRDKWSVGAAVRFEDFADFGTTLNGKVAGRYGFSDAFAVRASVSTGFRAPTPGQQNAFNVSTEFDLINMELVNNGTIPSTSAVAELRGGEPLTAEKSVNYALGLIYNSSSFTVTADLFRIDLRDRLALTQLFMLTPDEVDDLIAEGVTSAGNLQNFRFFTNDFDTETSGLDLVVTYDPPALENSSFSFIYNHTSTKVAAFNPDTLDQIRIQELEEALPKNRFVLGYNHRFGSSLNLLGRVNFYDGWFDSEDGESYPGEVTVDLEVGYNVFDRFNVVVGAQNVLNNVPEENPNAAAGVGNQYSQFSPFGFNGAFWYARVAYDL